MRGPITQQKTGDEKPRRREGEKKGTIGGWLVFCKDNRRDVKTGALTNLTLSPGGKRFSFAEQREGKSRRDRMREGIEGNQAAAAQTTLGYKKTTPGCYFADSTKNSCDALPPLIFGNLAGERKRHTEGQPL